MKVKFSKEQKFVPKFGGNDELPEADQFYAQISPMTTGDMIFIMDGMQEAGLAGIDPESLTGEKATQIKVTQFSSMVGKAKEILPKYVKLIGLQDEEGTEITIEDVVNYSQFLPLATELLGELSDVSTPSGQEEKNLVMQ